MTTYGQPTTSSSVPAPAPAPTNVPTVVSTPAATPAPPPTIATVPAMDIQAQAELLSSVIPAHVASNPALLPQYLQLLQTLVEQGVPPDQWNLVISILQEQQATEAAPAVNEAPRERRRSRSPSMQRSTPLGDHTYRQRTPTRVASPSQRLDEISLTTGPKWIDYDTSVPQGCIKGLRSLSSTALLI